MSDVFTFEFTPFNVLNATEQALVVDAAVLVQRHIGQTLGTPSQPTEHLWLMQRGHVQREEDGHSHVLGAGETIGWRALMTGHSHATCTALDEVLAWQLPKALLLRLLGDNPRFASLVFAEVARHLASDAASDHNREMMSLMLVRVKDAYLQKPLYVDGDLDLVSVCRILSENKRSHVLVRDAQPGATRVGIFTTTDLREAVLNPIAPNALPVRAAARFDLISVSPDAELFDVLLVMLRHRVHRVLVQDGEQILGVLSQLDLMSFMSNHSHLITLQVEQAHRRRVTHSRLAGG